MTEPISNERLAEMLAEVQAATAAAIGEWPYKASAGVTFDTMRSILTELQSRRQSPAGVEPVGEAGAMPGSNGGFTMAAFKTSKVPVGTKLYASHPKAVTITDEMRQAIRVLKLIADGYSAKGDGLGEFVQVENPDYRIDNGSDPYIVVDIAALSSEVQPTHRHKKRGSVYVLIGIGKMQSQWWFEPSYPIGEPVSVDMSEVAIYQSVEDGSLWARPREEFEDGRFESLSSEAHNG